MTPPLIRIELENMRQCMIHAFSESKLKLDEMFKAAVDEACDPKRVQMILNDAAKTYLNEAIQEETKAFFGYGGEGRKQVKAEVEKRLREEREVF